MNIKYKISLKQVIYTEIGKIIIDIFEYGLCFKLIN